MLVGREKKVPMAFVHGAKDDRGASQAKWYLDTVKGTSDGLKGTNVQKIADTNLTGSALLRQELSTQSWITEKYLPFIQEKSFPNKWARRDLDRTGYVWVFQSLGIPMLAKGERSRVFEPIPIERIGLAP